MGILGPVVESQGGYYKQRYSINLRAIIGCNLVFLDISTGYPWSLHDSKVLRNFEVYTKAEKMDPFLQLKITKFSHCFSEMVDISY